MALALSCLALAVASDGSACMDSLHPLDNCMLDVTTIDRVYMLKNLKVHWMYPVPTMCSKICTVFNVRDFGAAGDGKTRDDVAIKAALTACQKNNGGVVLFPSGGKYLTGPFEIACNNSEFVVEPSSTILSISSTGSTDGWPLGLDCPEPSQGKTSKQARN